MRKQIKYSSLVALLIVGSAITLLSCTEHKAPPRAVSYETLMGESSDNLTVVVSENGRPSYRFITPLLEGYNMAREPYREFRKGIEIITYHDDSLQSEDSRLRSNYAIYYSKLKLWEAKGDVVAIKQDGKELYTQQLFWNSSTKRIYSNVDTKIIDTNTGDTYIGEGFESDEEMNNWTFRKMKGKMSVDTSPTEPDTTAVASPKAPRSEPKSEEKATTPPSTSAKKSSAEPISPFSDGAKEPQRPTNNTSTEGVAPKMQSVERVNGGIISSKMGRE